MKGALISMGWIFLISCHSKTNTSQQLVKVNTFFMDSIRRSADTFYETKYGAAQFVKAKYYVDRKNGVVCQEMKDSLDSTRQIVITKNNKRIFFAAYYPNGQLIAQLPLDSFGQYHGPSKYFYPNGIVESEGDYMHGLKTGTWNNNNEQGKRVNTSEYNNDGQVIKTTSQK